MIEPLRVLHQFALPNVSDDELTTYVQRTRRAAGCREAEVYRTISADPAVALLELWEDQYAYGAYWSTNVADGEGLLLAACIEGRVTSEFYRQRYFAPGPVWTPTESRGRTRSVFWPATAPVRILITASVADIDELTPALKVETTETRREPGCVEYAFYRSVEFPAHLAVLELWQDQSVYDAHWQLRMKTGKAGAGGGESAPREHGSNGFEFYRQQTFMHLFDRWLPTAETHWSETIAWAD